MTSTISTTPALIALVDAAADIVEKLAQDLKADATTIANDRFNTNAALANFAVGALLPIEKTAADLLALLAAARALQGVK